MKATLKQANRSWTVEILEREESKPLSNGMRVWCGKVALPGPQVVVDLNLLVEIVLVDGSVLQATVADKSPGFVYVTGAIR